MFWNKTLQFEKNKDHKLTYLRKTLIKLIMVRLKIKLDEDLLFYINKLCNKISISDLKQSWENFVSDAYFVQNNMVAHTLYKYIITIAILQIP